VDHQISQLQLLKTSSTLIVLIVLLAWESSAPFMPLFQQRGTERARHGARNLVFGLMNGIIAGIGSVALWTAAANWAGANHFGVLNWTGLGPVARIPVAVLLFDLWMYWWHRMNHRLTFFWRFHRTHHSDPEMDVTTAHRFHFGEILLSSLLRTPVILLLGLQLPELLIYETLMFAVVQSHHANIALPSGLDRALRAVIVTPSIHKVHHSRWQPETDSNYSSLFSWWDRLFSTLRLREDPSTIRFGLEDFDRPANQSLAGMLKTPMGKGRP
jgi:sterol desaturase/sphingolipid hydroxylase (fatty acid hydroxylase superfamily)